MNTASFREQPTRGVPPKLGKGALCVGLRGPQRRKILARYGKLNWSVILEKHKHSRMRVVQNRMVSRMCGRMKEKRQKNEKKII